MRIGPRRLVIAAAAVVVLVAGCVTAYELTHEDSGIAECKAMRDHVDNGHTAKERYDNARDAYAGSGYRDLRDAGGRWADATWHLSQSATGNGPMPPAEEAVSAYKQLATACGQHGVQLAPLPG